MNAAPFARLLRAARRRQAAIALAFSLPWVLAIAALASGPGMAGPLPVVGLSLLALLAAAVMAWRSACRLDRGWLQRRLDATHPRLEDSSALLAAEPARLPPLARLQRQRLAQRLPPPEAAGVRAPWPVAGIAASAVAAGAVVAIALFLPGSPPAASVAEVPAPRAAGPALPGAPRLVERSLAITPPAYTGLPAREGDALDAKVPEGATLAWTLRFVPIPDEAALAFVDGRRIRLERDGDHWRGMLAAERPGLYRIATSPALPAEADALHRIDVVADRPPSIRVTAPAQTLSLRKPGQRHWDLAFEAADDHGIAAHADLHLTMTEGSGENIGFREEVRRIDGRGDRRRKGFSHRVDLDGLGLSEGDDLIVRFVVRDNRPGRAQATRSASHILRWPPPDAGTDSGMDGVLQKVLPAYFASQRQIIIDAEALLARKPRLPEEEFAARSDAIAVDQRLLRLRYGQFLGEESEGAPTRASAGTGGADGPPPPPVLLPTNDAEDEAEAWRAMASSQRQGDPADDQGHGVGGPGAAGEAHDHDHAAGDAAGDGGPGVAGFGVAGDVLQEFGHVHDIPEAATLLDPRTRNLLRRALGEMWQSELALRQARPQDALPPANRALALVKDIQQSDRIHLARTGSGLPPVDFSRRLTGERTGISSRRVPLPRAEPGEDVPAALWRALAGPSPGAIIDLDALQAWLASDEARGGDPLAVMAAVDAVRVDPACADCVARLRALLWPLVTPPPAAPRLRREADATGRAYLDALHAEAGE